MPRILELRQIDGQLWTRLEIDLVNTPAVALYTDEEVRGIRRDERQGCLWAIEQLDIPEKIKAQVIGAIR